MIKRMIISLVLLLSLLSASCSAAGRQPPAATQPPSAAGTPASTAAGDRPAQTTAALPQARLITPEEAKGRLETEQGIVLLDVREPEEYAEGHIAGSVLLPMGDITAKVEALVPEKDTVLFVYCRSGRRSALAADELVRMGYTQVFDLGGIIDWPYGVEK